MEVVTGFHAIEEFLKATVVMRTHSAFCTLYTTGKNKRAAALESLAKSRGFKVIVTNQSEIDKISGGRENRGAALVAENKLQITKKADNALLSKNKKHFSSLKDFIANLVAANAENSIALILDEITDPHNFGAILRSADQFSIDLVITPSRRSAGDNATIRKISSGAYEYVNIVEENLARSIELLKKNKFWVYGADMAGKCCWECSLKGRVAIVLGSEGSGISRLLAENCDGMVKIPALGHVDSFNVSVAAGILMYEIFRQQRAPCGELKMDN